MIRSVVLLGVLGVSAFAKPNIIFIIADDLGYGDLGCYGQKHFKTPVLDGLAAGGLRFTDHYSGSTVCAPSRCALMTGRDTGHSSIRGNGAFALLPDPADRTIASILQSAGYRTAMIGKSCVTGNTQDPNQVLNKGFDVFYGTTSHVDGHWRYPKFVYDQEKKVELEGNALHEGRHYDAELYTRRAERFVEENPAGHPFFMVLSYPIPHASVLAPGDLAGQAGISDDVDYTPKKFHYSRVKGVKSNYAGMMMAIDAYVGRVVKALEAKGIKDDTLVIFTSDNGSHFEGGYHITMMESNAPLRGGKRDLYEGGIRVPMIAYWPNGLARTGDVSHPSAFWDFMPTACELAAIDVPEGIEGISYAPTLTGRGVQKQHDALYWEFHEEGGRRALRAGTWKLVQYGLKPGNFGRLELYDLSKDIGEQNDLADQEPDRVKEMLARMEAARVENPRFKLPGLDGR